MSARKDSTAPKPALLRAMQNQSWTMHGAIAELIDNSLGAGRGNATDVKIVWDPQSRVLTVVDNGAGMPELKALFQLGETVGRKPDDIGEYGSGGTMALLYTSSHVELWSLMDGKVAYANVRWSDYFMGDEWPSVPTHWKRASLDNTPELLLAHGHGLMLRLHILKRRTVREANIRRDLQALYSPALRAGRKVTWTTAGQAPIPITDPLQTMHDVVDFNLTVESEGAHLVAYGQIGFVDDLPIERSRVLISFGHRVIKGTRDCFQHSVSAKKYSGVGVCGWIHLGNSWQGLYSTTKDDIDDSDAYSALMDAVFERIEPLLIKAQKRKQHLLLDSIALELQKMFTGGRLKVPATWGGDEGNPVDGPEGGPSKRPSTRKHGQRGTSGPGLQKDGDRPGATRPAVSELEITYLSDADMERALQKCYVNVRGESTTVEVFVNEDHFVVKTALEAYPINRMALALLVAQGVAGQIVVHPGILRDWFSSRIADDMEDMNVNQRIQVALRLLMDKFIAGQQEQQAA